MPSGQYTNNTKMSIRVRVPGFEPGISPPQGEVLTTILHTPGEAGYRSLYLSHAKRALYHLSYIPRYHAHSDAHDTFSLRTTHASPRSPPCTTLIPLPSRIFSACPTPQDPYASNLAKHKVLYGAFVLITAYSAYRSLYRSFVSCSFAKTLVNVGGDGINLGPPTSK